MIRVYYLPVSLFNNTEVIHGQEYIHDALLDCTEDPYIRRLTQDTTDAEHAHLVAFAVSWNVATQEEEAIYHAQVTPYIPDPDIARAQELLATSPDAITQPEMWELMRIFGRFHGVPD